jgi:hypothetical protein
MRIDAGIEDTESAVTIKEIVPTLAEARQEVERLMQQAPAGALYTWQAARYLPNGRSGKSTHPPRLLRVLGCLSQGKRVSVGPCFLRGIGG